MGNTDATHKPEDARAAAMFAARSLADHGYIAYFAGGCVRDELLGLHPTDYDIATNATPDQVRAVFRSTALVGVSFGVVIVRIDQRDHPSLSQPHTIEVATFRADGEYSDNRRPDEVHFADEIADARRRDFTINAMFLDPLAAPDGNGAEGTLHDHVQGIDDLRNRVIRAVGTPEDRLREDHLRALRGVRFAARFGFDIEPTTAAAIRDDASHLSGVSRERIGDEIRRMLTAPTRARAVQLMRLLGLESAILGALPEHASDRPTILAGLPDDADLPTALAAWALDRRENGTSFRTMLCLSNAETDDLMTLLDGVARAEHDWPILGTAHRKRLASRTGFDRVLAIIQSRNQTKASALRSDIRHLASTPGGLSPEPLLVGRTLIDHGFSPGPRFGMVLEKVYDAQLEGRISDVDEALGLARSLFDATGQG